jgi:hypothetical protein
VTEATLQQLELALTIVDRARIPGLTETARAGLSLLAEVRRLNGEVKRLEAGILPTDFEDTDPGKNGCRCDPDVDYYCDEHAFQREVLLWFSNFFLATAPLISKFQLVAVVQDFGGTPA